MTKLNTSHSSLKEFEYDVFISYRHHQPEMSWVRETLVPALEDNALNIFIDYKSFRLSAILIKEMERAVEQSKYTLAVLSPAYLVSNFTDLENLMADHLGAENSERRLLLIMREPCKPRLGLRARLWLDMTKDDEFEANLQRLVTELKQPPNF